MPREAPVTNATWLHGEFSHPLKNIHRSVEIIHTTKITGFKGAKKPCESKLPSTINNPSILVTLFLTAPNWKIHQTRNFRLLLFSGWNPTLPSPLPSSSPKRGLGLVSPNSHLAGKVETAFSSSLREGHWNQEKVGSQNDGNLLYIFWGVLMFRRCLERMSGTKLYSWWFFTNSFEKYAKKVKLDHLGPQIGMDIKHILEPPPRKSGWNMLKFWSSDGKTQLSFFFYPFSWFFSGLTDLIG